MSMKLLIKIKINSVEYVFIKIKIAILKNK